MSALPQGTVTFLFTDIEGSTRLLHELGDEYASALADHRRALRDAFARHGGVEVDTQGDAFFVAFAKASDALAAAAAARAALEDGPIRVRMGLHTGEPTVTGEGYVGLDVHRAARIASAGHGGQILVSQSTRDLANIELRDLGEHRLKDLAAPERIYQLGDGDFPPLKTLNNSNLPLPPEPLVGRKKELVDALRLFRNSTHLVTVVGPGGTGKTRFALEVGSELLETFRDGVWWVGLAPVRDSALVLSTIANAVGAKDDPSVELRGKRALLLLDNFEHVIDAAPHVADLQRRCRDVSLLVTSREPLHVAGERQFPLAPLAESPAVELFTQRAEAVAPEFDADYTTLAEVCDRLDRLPLAIELAAARIKALPPHELLRRLEQRLPLLTSRRRDVDERQRTLRSTIEWSYDLLRADEQQLFMELSIFAGSFAAAAAEEVCGADLDRIESLVDKSLLRRGDNGRFFLLETLREFGAEQLNAHGDEAACRRRLAAWVRRLADDAIEGLRGEQQAEVLEAVALEHAHIRSSLAFAIETGDSELALAIAGGLGRFWIFRGHDVEGYEWLSRALAIPGSADDARRWRALYWHAAVAEDVGDTDAAFASAQSALDLARRLEDDLFIEASIGELARRLIARDRKPEASVLLDEAEQRATLTGHRRGVAIVMTIRGQLLLADGQAAAAVAVLREALAIGRESGDTQVIGTIFAECALAEVTAHDLVAARQSLREALDIFGALQHAWGVATCLIAGAALAVAENDAAAASRMLEIEAALLEAVGAKPSGVDRELREMVLRDVRGTFSGFDDPPPPRDAPPDVDEAVSTVLRYLD